MAIDHSQHSNTSLLIESPLIVKSNLFIIHSHHYRHHFGKCDIMHVLSVPNAAHITTRNALRKLISTPEHPPTFAFMSKRKAPAQLSATAKQLPIDPAMIIQERKKRENSGYSKSQKPGNQADSRPEKSKTEKVNVSRESVNSRAGSKSVFARP